MRYSLYINQQLAVEWDLSLQETMLFSYLVNTPTGWMQRLPEDPEYQWASNAMLAAELPLVCSHKATARKHMAALEDRGLLIRRCVGNKSYFKITEKGFLWLDPEKHRASGTARPRASGSARPRASGSTHQSNTLTNQINPPTPLKGDESVSEVSQEPPKENATYDKTQKTVLRMYRAMLPELPQPNLKIWRGSTSHSTLATRLKARKEFREIGFWEAFFDAVRANEWYMDSPKRDGWTCDIHWLIKKANFEKVVNAALSE